MLFSIQDEILLEQIMTGKNISSIKLTPEEISAYWGLDAIAFNGICPRVYMNMGLPV